MEELVDGLFQIVKCECPLSTSGGVTVLGTAFAIQTPSIHFREYYLLTAYHTISESFAKGTQIFVRDGRLNIFSAEIMYPECFSPFSDSYFDDFALLRLISDREYNTFIIGQSNSPGPCYIRGAARHFDETLFTSFKGELFWREPSAKKSGEKVLVLDINTKLVFDDKTEVHVDQQKILGGLSGSPVIIIQGKKEIVVGLLSHIHPDGSASKCFGIPMESIITKCLLPRGLYSSIYIDTDLGPAMQTDGIYDVQFYMDYLFNGPDGFSLENCNQEAEMWNKISDQFYHGFPVDKIFCRAIASDNLSQYSSDVQVATRYYLARLMFKRGQKSAAYKQFSQIKEVQKKLSTTVNQRFTTLIEARDAVESAVANPQLQLDQIRRCRDKLSNLSMADDIYIANELASVSGRGLTNLFGQLDIQDYSDSLKNAIKDIFTEHCGLLSKYPVHLKKQDVVNTAVSWLINLWGILEKPNVEKLETDVLIGFQQAKMRENAIFHIQSLIVYSILLLLKENKQQALTGLFLSSLLMRINNLRSTHEGIGQLLRLLKLRYQDVYFVFELYDKLQQEDTKFFLEKASIYDIGVNPVVIGGLVQRANYIFISVYRPLGQNIFHGNIENVVALL